MKKIILLSSLAILLIATLQVKAVANKPAFEDKKTIAVWPFQGDNQYGAIEALHNIVTDAVNKSERFYLVERSKLNAILQELDLQKGYETMNSDVLVEQGKALGANYHLFGHINSVGTKSDRRTDSKNRAYTAYTCVISLNLRIVDIETGLVKETETITVGQDLFDAMLSSRDKNEAWNRTCKKMRTKVTKFIKKAFPLSISIVEIHKEKKGKAYELLIEAGDIAGLKKNDKLQVYELKPMTTSNGKTTDRKISVASLTVKEVQGDYVSLCRVKKGGGDLKNKFLGGAKLICETK